MNSHFGFARLRPSVQVSNAERASAQQGRLSGRPEVATLDAGIGFLIDDGQTRCVTVTFCHRVQIGVPADVRKWIGRPLRRQQGREQHDC
jgi:hypothetical protein